MIMMARAMVETLKTMRANAVTNVITMMVMVLAGARRFSAGSSFSHHLLHDDDSA